MTSLICRFVRSRARAMSTAVPPPLQLIDIGVNLTDPMYRGEYNGKQYHPTDLDAVISRAFQVHACVHARPCHYPRLRICAIGLYKRSRARTRARMHARTG